MKTIKVNMKTGVTTETSDFTLAELKDQKLDALAARRWEAEFSGTSLDGPPVVPIDTSQRTRDFIDGAYTKALANPLYEISSFKLAPGEFSSLSAVEIIAIGDQIEDHIQDCFANEETISDLIVAAADETALAAIDLESGWP